MYSFSIKKIKAQKKRATTKTLFIQTQKGKENCFFTYPCNVLHIKISVCDEVRQKQLISFFL